MWKTIRIVILLALLGAVAGNALLERARTHQWDRPVRVGLFPVAGDASPATAAYVRSLKHEEFADIEAFFANEAKRLQLGLDTPISVELYPDPGLAPPPMPVGGNPVAVIWWSLGMRLYAWRHGQAPDGGTPPIRIFLVYHDPALSPQVPHSAGLEKGLLGVTHVFATSRMRGDNNIVIAHELLHTLGATDEYDARTNLPSYPDGYGDPNQVPRFPQHWTEIMAGRRAISPTAAEMPPSLEDCLIGPRTAAEIRWTRPGARPH